MTPEEFVNLIQVVERDSVGDYREFSLIVQYMEDGKGLQFTDNIRISGTEEAIVGRSGIGQKIDRRLKSFAEHLIKHIEESGKKFEIRSKQLWIISNE